jgi:hypothetical protein
MPSPRLEVRALGNRLERIDGVAALRSCTRSAIVIEAIDEYLARHARDAEDLAWELANLYSHASHRPVATFDVDAELRVTVGLDCDGPSFGQHATASARRDGAEIVLELRGHDPAYAGIVLPIGRLSARGGTLTVALEDLAPSLVEAA